MKKSEYAKADTAMIAVHISIQAVVEVLGGKVRVSFGPDSEYLGTGSDVKSAECADASNRFRFYAAPSIRQSYAALILRGIKTIEYRSRPTKIIGERFYIYAACKWAGVNGHAPGREGIEPCDAPSGVLVGTAIISHCTPASAEPGGFQWHLSDVKRLEHPRRPKRMPQSVWFRPF